MSDTPTTPTAVPPSVATGQSSTGSSFIDQLNNAAMGGDPSSGSTTSSSSTTTGSTTGSQIVAPSAAVSAYEYTQVLDANVVLGPQMAKLLGLPSGSTLKGGQVMNAFYEMPHTSLIQLEQQLYAAGLYASDTGEQLSTMPVFGAYDIDAFNALSQAILQINNAPGETLSNLIAQNMNSGAGQAKLQTVISPVTGGGNTYQIDLTNPEDILSQAMTTFQSLLGRNPTASEEAEIQSNLQSQETTQQESVNTQAENMSQAKYQQEINSRTAELTPTVANGNVPNGPFTTPAQWVVALLQYMGDPTTVSNVQVLTAWVEANGGLNGQGNKNPLGVTASQSGSTQTQSGGQSYMAWAQGIQAAANMLSSPKFANIASALQSGKASAKATSSAFTSELSQWSGGQVTSLNTAAQAKTAQQAVGKYVSQATSTAQPLLSRSQAPNFMGVPCRRPQLCRRSGQRIPISWGRCRTRLSRRASRPRRRRPRQR